MAVLFTSKKKESSVNLLRTYFDENQLWKSLEDPLEIAIKIIAAIRPKNPTNVEMVELTDWIDFLQSNEFVRIQFSQYVKSILFEKNSVKF
jgi:hypothetical protein